MSTRDWASQERRYRADFSTNTFTKTEIPSWKDIEGKITTPWRSQERLLNEFTSLRFIAERTTLPVPQPLRLEFIDDCLSMTTEFIDGVPFDELAPGLRSLQYLEDYVQTKVLPELQALKSQTVGGPLTGMIIPPRRVFDHEQQHPKCWVTKTCGTAEYNFIHGDLGQHNFLCDPETGEVKAIIDREYAGFYPAYFEAPLWRRPYYEAVDDPDEIVRLRTFLDSL